MSKIESGSVSGLTHAEAARLLVEFGPNMLPQAAKPGFAQIFLSQYKSPFIYVLLVAALVSLALGQLINFVFIFLVLLLNASIGAFQEYAAQKAATGLEKMVPQRATVIREGLPIVIEAENVVPGDLLVLVSGDKVPADIRLTDVSDLQVDESMLTGESIAAEKNISIASSESMSPGDRLDMAFAGTMVLRGRAQGEVVSTGISTEIGKIVVDVTSGTFVQPPLMQRMHQFTMRVTWSMLVLIAVIFLITLVRGDDVTTVFFLGVALAVSAIPEGLPVAITVALAIGMQRMAKSGVIIRNLVAVESLGSCTLIASDKTGTLTVNEMTIRKIILADGAEYSVTGEGVNLEGAILPDAKNDKTGPQSEHLQQLLHAGLLANEAYLTLSDNSVTGQGDAVDIAFLILAAKQGLSADAVRDDHTELAAIAYESQNAFSASLNQYDNGVELFVKGSTEKLLEMMAVSAANQKFAARAEDMARQGYRVLALAHRLLPDLPDDPRQGLVDLEFIGLVGMIDPLRPEVIDAVAQCRDANIRVVMVTGDHPETAAVLASELGISRSERDGRKRDVPASGQQLTAAAEMGPSEFDQLVASSRVFARVAPRQKMEIVESYIKSGEFVAVTGDGINDAPALKKAHIGISMGLRGSDVARENSDMILTDDNFASIVQGVKQGRIVYNNIRKVIFLLISTGAAEITLILLSLLFGMPLPLLPLQLLWLNLVTNGIQDVALVFEPEEGTELNQRPRDPKEPIFNRIMIERVVVNAAIMGCLAFAVFYWQIQMGVDETSARNITLLLMVLFENVHVFNSRSETLSIFKQNFFGNPFLLFGMLAAQGIHIIAMHTPGLSTVLGIEPVSFNQWVQLLGIALILILVDEAHKFWIAFSKQRLQ